MSKDKETSTFSECFAFGLGCVHLGLLCLTEGFFRGINAIATKALLFIPSNSTSEKQASNANGEGGKQDQIPTNHDDDDLQASMWLDLPPPSISEKGKQMIQDGFAPPTREPVEEPPPEKPRYKKGSIQERLNRK